MVLAECVLHLVNDLGCVLRVTGYVLTDSDWLCVNGGHWLCVNGGQ